MTWMSMTHSHALQVCNQHVAYINLPNLFSPWESSVRGPWQRHHTPTLMDGTSRSKNELDCPAFHKIMFGEWRVPRVRYVAVVVGTAGDGPERRACVWVLRGVLQQFSHRSQRSTFAFEVIKWVKARSHLRSPTHPANCWEAEKICHPVGTRGQYLRFCFVTWPVCPPRSGVVSNSQYCWVLNGMECRLINFSMTWTCHSDTAVNGSSRKTYSNEVSSTSCPGGHRRPKFFTKGIKLGSNSCWKWWERPEKRISSPRKRARLLGGIRVLTEVADYLIYCSHSLV